MSEQKFKVVSIYEPQGRKQLIALAENKELVILVGSAISIWPPSSIPSGQAIRNDISGLLARQLDSHRAKTKDVAKAISKTPFEYLCEQSLNQGALEKALIEFFGPRPPNSAHESLASLVRIGAVHSVITPNYDTCLEKLLPDNEPLAHVVTKDQVPNDPKKERMLFKIHGAPHIKTRDGSTSMVYKLSQEGELDRWKSDLLAAVLQGRVLLTLGYSGSDFEICPELTHAEPEVIIWNSWKNPRMVVSDALASSAENLLNQKQGVVIVGDLRDVLVQLGGSCIQHRDTIGESDLSSKLENKLSAADLKAWAFRSLSPPGYAKYAELIARDLLKSSLRGSQERDLYRFYLADAQFSKGRYRKAAKLAFRSSRSFLSRSELELWFAAEIKGIDSVRCEGRYAYARQRLARARRIIRSSPMEKEKLLLSKINLQDAQVCRDEYDQARNLGRVELPFLVETKDPQAVVERAKRLLAEISRVSAEMGQIHDLQLCKMLADRMGIPFTEVYDGRLEAAGGTFGWEKLGHQVPVMMATRDQLYNKGEAAIEEDKLVELIRTARRIGCSPEVWKLTLSLWRYFGFRIGRELLYGLVAFIRCQYTIKWRLTKLLSERYGLSIGSGHR